MRLPTSPSKAILMPVLKSLIIVILLGFAGLVQAGERIAIAAAADLRFALDEIVRQFLAANPDDTIEVSYGSSGKFFTQIQQGAPYDLFFSADIAYPRALEKAGYAGSPVIPYAIGRLVLWSTGRDAAKLTLDDLADPRIGKVAIANPQHAPYGKRAEEALKARGLWQAVSAKAVYGENISQTAQFVQTGNADIGIIALSLAAEPGAGRKRQLRIDSRQSSPAPRTGLSHPQACHRQAAGPTFCGTDVESRHAGRDETPWLPNPERSHGQ